MSVVHFPTSITSTMRRGDALLEVTTRCGKKLAVTQKKGQCLLDVGLSGWYSQMTCEPCKNPNTEHREEVPHG